MHPHAEPVHEAEPAQSGLLDTAEQASASGTAWQPAATPMHGWMVGSGGWMLMAHANVFVGWDVQGSERGGSAFTSTNWLMAMARYRTGPADHTLRAMLSLEPWTVTDPGYPLLLQTGESFRGEPIHDAQHPHELFMELAAIERVTLGHHLGLELYAAPVGEPALGPVAFPHRASALPDPLAPLTHHWLDDTHIRFGVLTAGVFTSFAKLEGSWFNGREPDETRTDLDLRVPDSWSARLTVNPTDALSAQLSYGWLASPEARHPDQPGRRLTTSVLATHALAKHTSLSGTAAWGWNLDAGHAVLVEGALDFGGNLTLYGRGEYVEKSAEDLALAGDSGQTWGIPAADLGVAVGLEPIPSWNVSIGARGNVAALPTTLEAAYGTRTPIGGIVYLRLSPGEAARHTTH